MELKLNVATKCDNCGKNARFRLSQKKRLTRANMDLCEECFRALYAFMGCYITPTSPAPPYKLKKENNSED